jgi:hypothetical protein
MGNDRGASAHKTMCLLAGSGHIGHSPIWTLAVLCRKRYAYLGAMPRAEIVSKQAIFKLSQLHAELAGKFLENRRAG